MLVPPAPSSIRNRSSDVSAVAAVAPSISIAEAGTVPADKPEPEPLNEDAVTIPEAFTVTAES